jgi:hypothetical protein
MLDSDAYLSLGRLVMGATKRCISFLRCLTVTESSVQTRHLLPNGLKKFLVNNVRELDLLLMHNKTFAAEIAHGVSSRNRITILDRYEPPSPR